MNGQHSGTTHVDRGALHYLLRLFDIKTFIDIGCGPGGMVEMAQERGLEAIGIDCDDSLVDHWEEIGINCFVHDYSKMPLGTTEIDLCWMVEFLEHVSEKYIYNIFSTVENCKYVCMTHALPDTPGRNHVNCRDDEYWIARFEDFGFTYDEAMSNSMRGKSTMGRCFMRETGKLFIRND